LANQNQILGQFNNVISFYYRRETNGKRAVFWDGQSSCHLQSVCKLQGIWFCALGNFMLVDFECFPYNIFV